MLKVDNKYTYFLIEINLPESYTNHLKENLNDSIDMVLYSMGAANNDPKNYKLISNKGNKIIQIFRCQSRKRKGQLNKFCNRYLPENLEINASGIDKNQVSELLSKAKVNNFEIISEASKNESNSYEGRDIAVFKNKKNWFNWQTEIYNKIYDKQGQIKEPDLRSIISIVDFEGNSGKTSFFKYLYIQDRKNIGRITYGTAAQLRSAAVGLGEKKIYIIDLARTKAKEDRQDDLLSVIEDIKSGMVFTAMYGQAKELIIEPPHLIVSSNYVLNSESLSKDRWETFEIKKDKTLGPKNAVYRKEQIKK